MKCVICEKELGDRPHDFISMHRAEGIMLVPFCGKNNCKEKVGIWLAFTQMPTDDQVNRIFAVINETVWE